MKPIALALSLALADRVSAETIDNARDGFSLTVPAGWTEISRADFARIMAEGRKMPPTDDAASADDAPEPALVSIVESIRPAEAPLPRNRDLELEEDRKFKKDREFEKNLAQDESRAHIFLILALVLAAIGILANLIARKRAKPAS